MNTLDESPDLRDDADVFEDELRAELADRGIVSAL
jgi:hypothetical protein